jgi:orotate phosphoribosyltransferase
VSVSRGISKATDMAAAAIEVRDEINACRAQFLAARAGSSASAAATESELLAYQKEFIEFAVGANVLQFGSFKLKSGRISPYFFNAGLFCSGQSLLSLGRFYAMAIKQSGIEFDVIFGPAYKGIPLATAVALSWCQLYGESKDICYNRKEVKDHGEGGQLVGASMKGRRVLVVDDVITAGTAIRESVDILKAAEANLAAVVVSLDRQEKASDTAAESAIQQVESEFGIPVLSIVRLKHLVSYVKSAAASKAGAESDDLLQRIEQYRAQYGVNY